MGISIGLVGLGAFGSEFADMFRSHPLVDRIALCDREPERIRKFAEKASWQDKFNPRDAYASLDAICKSDLDALVIITQPWLHAPQCVQVMESGKHVYSAVPIISIPNDEETLEWCDRLVNTCRKTGLSYMLGETTYFHAQSMFCRRKAAEGAFGNFIYAEGEYFHDVDSGCSLRNVEKSRAASQAGQEGKALRAQYIKDGFRSGPMHYPTHSTSGPVCVMKAHALKATCYGYKNQNQDPFFGGYAFSDETALFKMSNGATVRICEFREVAGSIADESETFRILGTSGSFCEDRWMENGRTAPLTAQPLKLQKMTVDEMRDPLPPEVYAAFRTCNTDSGVYGGHGGSHAYLVNEFVEAIATRRQPAINIWEAARYMAMGVTAHQSALRDGETLNVPDWGDAPA